MAQKQKNLQSLIVRSEPAAKCLMFVAAGVMVLSPVPMVAAAEYDAQIKSTKSAVSSYEEQQVRLAAFAKKVETRLANLQQQISSVNTEIRRNERTFQLLSLKLDTKKRLVAERSDNVEAVLRQAYLDSRTSLVEMIASRKSLSHYMDYYAARDKIQSELASDLNVLKAAKAKVKAQRDEIAVVLKDGRAMRDTLEHKRQEQTDLLERTRGQQRAYEQLIRQRNANIAELRAQQRDANTSYFVTGKLIPGDPNKGGYPDRLDSAAQDSLVDPWGMFNRECVSYTAWKVQQTTGKMPYWGGRGNANQWPSSARTDGIKTGDVPKKHAVAIAFIGPYGHAMFVEEILGGGKIRISEYNYFVNGTYTERIIDGGGLEYIYFK